MDQRPLQSPHPISDLSWLSNTAYCQAIAAILKKDYDFNGRFTYQGAAYGVNRVNVYQAFESPADNPSDVARRGLEKILYTFKRPDWEPRANDWQDMNMAAPTGAIANLGGPQEVTQHVIRLRNAQLSNYLPFRK